MTAIRYLFIYLAVYLSCCFLPTAESYADRINAASASYIDVSAAIASAALGDTVIVPAQSSTWTSTLTITKGINLIGAGIDKTVITNGIAAHSALIIYNPINYDFNTPFRISGFTFDLNSNGHGIVLGTTKMAPFTVQTKVRVDHNKFINSPMLNYQAITNRGTMNGVIDNNITDGVWYPIRNDPSLGTNGGRSWYQYLYPNWDTGNAYTMIYEDNTFLDLRDGTAIDSVLINCQYAGRYVLRYNTISLYKGSQNLTDFHGADWSPADKMYGCFGAEIYGNEITNLATDVTPSTNAMVSFVADRSGKAMIFYNTALTPGQFRGKTYNNPPALTPCPSDYIAEQIIHDTYIWSNRKNLTGDMDGWDILNPMSCGGLDNIPLKNRDVFLDVGESPGMSCGTLANIPPTCAIGTGYWATDQSCTDLTGMVGANPSNPIKGTLYKCSATDTWIPFYTPYPYPHPLTVPSPPEALQINN